MISCFRQTHKLTSTKMSTVALVSISITLSVSTTHNSSMPMELIRKQSGTRSSKAIASMFKNTPQIKLSLTSCTLVESKLMLKRCNQAYSSITNVRKHVFNSLITFHWNKTMFNLQTLAKKLCSRFSCCEYISSNSIKYQSRSMISFMVF